MDFSPTDLPIQTAQVVTSRQLQELPTTPLPDQSLLTKQSQLLLSNLELPTDHPRLLNQTPVYRKYSFLLPQHIRMAVLELEQVEGIALYEILLATFLVLLHRYTNQDEILLGTSYVERARLTLSDDVESFTNNSFLHTNMSGNPSFRELLERVLDGVWDTTTQHVVPFKKNVEDWQQETEQYPSGQYQVLFHFEKMVTEKPGTLELDKSSIDENARNNQTEPCELTLTVLELEQELRGYIEYRADLFEEATIARLAGHWQSLLAGVSSDPTQRLSALPLLTKSEQEQILVEWNATTADYPLDQCIHHLFEAQVERTPEAVAVASVEGKLTYRELNQRANQLAHYLQQRGVGPETLVGLCVERSLAMIVGVLGILKAGGAYIPLDPSYPQDRLAFMLTDSQVAILLIQERLLGSIPSNKIDVVCLDKNWDTISLKSTENPHSEAMAENTAYIIYTSGSTGKPKGVVIEHRSLVNYTMAACDAYTIDQEDRVLQFAPLSFDTSAEEIYPCLTTAATLVLRTTSMIDSISLFLQKCEEWKLTVLDLPTAFWHELTRKVAADAITLPRSLRLVIIGGERALPEIMALWQKSGNRHVKLMNTYGPTEGTIVATMYEVPESTAARSTLREVPIGRAVSNVQVYLLDRYLNAVPIGVPGELHIGGAGLAREYLNRPMITREKFIPHPFDLSAEARLYKTGDRARYLPSGDIEFLGRLDQQVKVRGFRIELGEIEATLWKHPDVHEAIVVAREDASSGKRLVAYVVPQRGRSLTSRDLQSFMREQLPDYMVPSAIVLLESLPLTPSGKINRLALPAPEQARPESEEARAAPTLPEHQQLIEVWEELLNVRPIGIQDNFFQLGGHSLLAVRLVDRIEQLWGKKVSATTLIENATVEQLVAVLFQPKDLITEELKISSSNGTGRDTHKGISSPAKSIWGRLIGKKKQG